MGVFVNVMAWGLLGNESLPEALLMTMVYTKWVHRGIVGEFKCHI